MALSTARPANGTTERAASVAIGPAAPIDLRLRSDVAEIKTDVRSLRDRMDARFDAVDKRFDGKFDVFDRKSDAFENKVDAKFDAVDKKFDAFDKNLDASFNDLSARLDKLRESLVSAQILALMFYIGLTVALFGTLARGFGWFSLPPSTQIPTATTASPASKPPMIGPRIGIGA